MAADGERIASLEAKADEAQRQRETMLAKLERQDDDLRAIRDDVARISATLERYQGFLGGVMFVLTAVGAAFGAILTLFWNRLTGQP